MVTESFASWPDPARWREALRAHEAEVSAWAGPRPLQHDHDRGQLVGRDTDVRRFFDNLHFKRIVHLIGESGVGKSSLVMAAIVPQFEERDYTAVLCRDWSNVGDEDFDAFIAKRLHASLPADRAHEFEPDTSIFFDLDDLEGRSVVVLDQFEEVVRHSEEVRTAAFELVTKLYLRTQIPVVLSYRSEYRHVFEALDKDLRIEHDHTRVQVVDPLPPEVSLKLVTSPRLPAGVIGDDAWRTVIHPDAVARISADWKAMAEARSHDRIPIGMLNLQALLFVLSQARGSTVDETRAIAESDYQIFHDEAARRGHDSPAGRMSFALQQCAAARVGIARTIGFGVGMDAVLLDGIEELLARIVPRLSSGGFKIELDAVVLAEQLFDEEFDAAVALLEDRNLGDIQGVRSLASAFTTPPTADDDAAASSPESDVAAVLTLGRRAAVRHAVAAGEPALELHEVERLLAPPESDGLTSGLLRGLGPVHLLVEELRRLGWAQLWLHELNLARTDTDNSRRAKMMLVHDGLGDPLQAWSREWRGDHPNQMVTALAAPQGAQHEWGNEGVSGEVGQPRYHVNLKLDGNSIIGAEVSHVVFANCDFLGTLFLKCTFEDVTFLNCRLDGALFSDCVVRGAQAVVDEYEDAEPEGRPDPGGQVVDEQDEEAELPPFTLLDATTSARMARYHEIDPAHPIVVTTDPDHPAAVMTSAPHECVEFVPTPGGLTILGSRLSSLTFRSTTFEPPTSGTTRPSEVRFVHVRGAGLDVVQLTAGSGEAAGRWVFDSSVIRHAGFTSDGGTRALDLEVRWSVVGQWWVGDDVAVSGRIVDSLVSQLRVQDGRSTLTWDRWCVAHGLVGCEATPEEDAAPAEQFRWPDGSDGLVAAPSRIHERFATRIRRADYRRPS